MDYASAVYKNNKQRHVALLIDCYSGEYSRSLVHGVKKYLSENPHWSIFLHEQEKGRTNLSGLLKWEGDGILARIENEETADFIRSKNLPTVDLCHNRLIPELPYVETNCENFSLQAIEHLLSKGYRNLGFCGNSKYIWSKRREQYFIARAEKKGASYFLFDTHMYHRQSVEERMAIIAWLKSLPKPIGIMCYYDRQGHQLLEACKIAKISVPESIGVVGVGNDEIICELSTPSLTSIIPNSRQAGYEAAKILDKMMNGEQTDRTGYLFDPLGVQTRQSTDILVTDDIIIAEALNYIRQNAHRGITVYDVLKKVPLSRRAFEVRFVKSVGRTPHDEIWAVRLNLVRRLLKETNLPLDEIAEKTGFAHTEYMSVAFKRESSMTPSEYRKFSI